MLIDRQAMAESWDWFGKMVNNSTEPGFAIDKDNYDSALEEVGIDPAALHDVSKHYSEGVTHPPIFFEVIRHIPPHDLLNTLLYNAFRQGFCIGVGAVWGKKNEESP